MYFRFSCTNITSHNFPFRYEIIVIRVNFRIPIARIFILFRQSEFKHLTPVLYGYFQLIHTSPTYPLFCSVLPNRSQLVSAVIFCDCLFQVRPLGTHFLVRLGVAWNPIGRVIYGSWFMPLSSHRINGFSLALTKSVSVIILYDEDIPAPPIRNYG